MHVLLLVLSLLKNNIDLVVEKGASYGVCSFAFGYRLVLTAEAVVAGNNNNNGGELLKTFFSKSVYTKNVVNACVKV